MLVLFPIDFRANDKNQAAQYKPLTNYKTVASRQRIIKTLFTVIKTIQYV